MPTAIEDKKLKKILKDAIEELIETKTALFKQVVVEAIEDASLANAIKEGRKGDFVEEARIKALLKG